MSVQKILSTDTLETGFRAKYNETVDEIIVSAAVFYDAAVPNNPNNGRIELTKFSGAKIFCDIQTAYYTKAQINATLAGIASAVYVGSWAAIAYAAGIVVDYNNQLYKSNTATIAGDIPGISNKWVLLLRSLLPTWVAGTYNKNEQVKYNIGGVFYLFVSQTNTNTTVPSLIAGIYPWTKSQIIGIDSLYAGVWAAGAYLANQTVNRGIYLYLALNNNSNDPATDLVNWISLGTYQGVYNPATTYASADAVTDISGLSYSSNIDANNFILDAGSSNQWDLIGSNPDNSSISINIPSGTATPHVIPYTYGFGANPQLNWEIVDSDTQTHDIYDVLCYKNYTDNTKTVLDNLTIMGFISDNLRLTIR